MELLASLAKAARERKIELPRDALARAPSLAKALAKPGIIAELKPASPTEGAMRQLTDELAQSLVKAGAAGLSALTEPTRFGGSPEILRMAKRTGAPVLMKDFIVTNAQLELAQTTGASAVLLILPLLTREHSEWSTPDDAIQAARDKDLEVLLEIYDDEDYFLAGLLDADMVGINNRDLRDDALPVDAERTIGVLGRCGGIDAPVIALSGASNAADVHAQIKAGARGVLVGSALMKAVDPAAKLVEMLEGTK